MNPYSRNLGGLERAHRRHAARTNRYRCSGTNLKGARCLSSGRFRVGDAWYCRWHVPTTTDGDTE